MYREMGRMKKRGRRRRLWVWVVCRERDAGEEGYEVQP